MFHRATKYGLSAVVLLFATSAWSQSATQPPQADSTPYCGNEGVWIQILGGGGPELTDGQAGASYVLFADNRARLLVDTAPGSSVGFDRSGALSADLEAIVFTHLHADHAVDLPAFVMGSSFAERTALLPVFGPDGAGPYPDTITFVDRLIGDQGAFAYLADFLTFKSSGGYKLSVRNVPAAGRREWSGFGTEDLKLSAIPVHHGPVPALAWKAAIGGKTIVFTGDFNNAKDVMRTFARDADALVIHHAVPEGTRGEAADLFVTPTQIGEIAAAAKVRMVILGHRMNRTRGLESVSSEAIEAHYQGPLIFANDLECWGL